jgi:hypothetical protein
MHIFKRRDIGVFEGEGVFRVDVEVVRETLMTVVMGVGCQQYIQSLLFSHIELVLHFVVDKESVGHLPSVTPKRLRA